MWDVLYPVEEKTLGTRLVSSATWVSKQRANTRKMSRIISSLCRFFCFQRLECLMLSRHVSNLLPHFYNVAFFYSFYNADIKREFSLFPHGVLIFNLKKYEKKDKTKQKQTHTFVFLKFPR